MKRRSPRLFSSRPSLGFRSSGVFGLARVLRLFCIFCLASSLGASMEAGGHPSLPASRPVFAASKPVFAPSLYPSTEPCPRWEDFAFKTKQSQTFAEATRYRCTIPSAGVVPWYRALAKLDARLRVERIGESDGGRPLHLVVASETPGLQAKDALATGKIVVLVINGIHAGESCGVDATQALLRDLLGKPAFQGLLSKVVLLAIPVFNVDGHAHFSPFHRVNQEGPAWMGSRTNARNLNLNRDFMKADTSEMRAFLKVFHAWKPHLLVDTHTTNGADYQYPMTYLLSDTPDIAPPLRSFVTESLRPSLERRMDGQGFPIFPYVIQKKEEDIRKGLLKGIAPPRFSTGFAPLFHTVAFLSEVHMLKPFQIRVQATSVLLQNLLALAATHASLWQEARRKALAHDMQAKDATLVWRRTEKFHLRSFRGYRALQVKGPVSGGLWYRYDRSQPLTKQLPFYDDIQPHLSTRIPTAYILPQAWKAVLQRLQQNQIQMVALPKATDILVEETLVSQRAFASAPYEGRQTVALKKDLRRVQTLRFQKGDLVIPTAQAGRLYLLQALEPQASDSFFAWGFFSTIMQQQEFFDPYLFEPLAAALLRRHPDLRSRYEKRLQAEPTFAADPYQRLLFLYQASPFYEKGHNVYPIRRYYGPLNALQP